MLLRALLACGCQASCELGELTPLRAPLADELQSELKSELQAHSSMARTFATS